MLKSRYWVVHIVVVMIQHVPLAPDTTVDYSHISINTLY